MYADVLIAYGVKTLDRTFTYHIPQSLEEQIAVGMKVYVPFGKQKINGFVLNITPTTEVNDTKDIIGIVTRELKLNDELIKLGKYLKDQTLCSLITAYQTMLPTSLKVKNSKDYRLTKTYIALNKPDDVIADYIDHNKRALKQNEILLKLKTGRILKGKIAGSSLNKLLTLELVREEQEEDYRIKPHSLNHQIYTLTEDQNGAYETIKAGFNQANTYLLHGVTGSGKTEVYMHLVSDIIRQDKTVIMLVPEISLTTQIVRRFYDRFASEVAVFHSNLSEGEKYDEYKKIMNGEVHIVVGTRSAIFTPVKNLGLIIIDEEHSANYKQENNPRYHALDMAIWRSKYHHCPVVLGSATPSLESMARALKGVYTYVSLKKRIGQATLPTINIVDMAAEYKKRNLILSDLLKEKIMERLDNHEQIMLLLNRRGYSTIITCQSCGYTFKCPHCDITLTYHKTNNNLRCHYCGYTVIRPELCPECHEKAIQDFGLGTEKVERQIRELFPSYRIVRMDADTTSKKGSHEEIIRGIENLEYDIIIGTQMISKGLDFPRVSLVGIINADESLNIPDFRSGENTFSLLSQVSGRAGRGTIPGEVIIQTFNPDNKTLQYVQENNYLANYQYEMNIRKLLKYPPYYYLTSIKITGKDYALLSQEATKVATFLRRKLSPETITLGPTPASVFKINNIYRFQIIIKYRHEIKLKEVLKELDNEYILNKNINIEIDINPLRI